MSKQKHPMHCPDAAPERLGGEEVKVRPGVESAGSLSKARHQSASGFSGVSHGHYRAPDDGEPELMGPHDLRGQRSFKSHLGDYSQSLEFLSPTNLPTEQTSVRYDSPHGNRSTESLMLQRAESTETQFLLSGNERVREALVDYGSIVDGSSSGNALARRPVPLPGETPNAEQGICPQCASLVYLEEANCPVCHIDLVPYHLSQGCAKLTPEACVARPRTFSDATLTMTVLGRHALASEAESHTGISLCASSSLSERRKRRQASETLEDDTVLRELAPLIYNERDALTDGTRAVNVPRDGKCLKLRQLLAFTGIGLIIAVGYMDPGNWATNLEAGSKFGYTHLTVVLLSSLLAMFLEFLALKLGIAADMDLAQACRTFYSRPLSIFLWATAEIAICATDLAEIIGTSVALNLLFDTPLILGVIISMLDVFIVLLFFHNRSNQRYLELMVGVIIAMIFSAFSFELVLSKPNWSQVFMGLLPDKSILANRDKLVVAAGILGATVMPHSLYLHSHLVRTRDVQRTKDDLDHAVHAASLDSMISLVIAFFVNAAILILSASAFYNPTTWGSARPVTDITDAFLLLSPTLGNRLASSIFALALLGSGHNSSITGTLAGTVVMEGFLNIQLPAWLRRLLTRFVAVVPAVVVAWLFGSQGVGRLLLWSQVLLSAQLAFAVVPLVDFTSRPEVMGTAYVNSRFTQICAVLASTGIIVLNLVLLVQNVVGDQ